MSSAVGMMDEAYFVGRREILDWINNILQLNLTKIEETASGCVALQLMDVCYPGQVNLHKANWSARNDYEFVHNYKLLQTAFDKFHVDKHIPVDKIVRAKYQDNLEFMQWFKRFTETTGPSPDYDPAAARARGKGAPGSVTVKAGATAAPRRDSASTRKASVSGASSGASKTAAAAGGSSSSSSGTATAAAARNGMRGSVTSARTAPTSAGSSSDLALAKAREEIRELKDAAEVLEKERDFYFEKLRDVEVLLQLKEEQGAPMEGTQDIFKILYATTDNCVAVAENGTVLEGEEAKAYKESAEAAPES